jgi:hypothetical protein
MLQRNTLPPSSGLKCKPRKKPVEAGDKLSLGCEVFSKLYSTTTQKTVLFIVVTTRTSNPI